MPFNDMQLKNLEIRNTPYRVWERGSDAGFNVQVRPNKTKTFYFFYTFNGKRRFMRLGEYIDKRPEGAPNPVVEARNELRKARALVDKGIDPQVAREEEKIRKAQELEKAKEEVLKEQSIGTIKQLFDYYTDQMRADNKSSWKETKRSLYKYVLSESEKDEAKLWEGTKAKDVKPQDIRKILFNIVARGALVLANRVRSYLCAAFNYGIEHDLDSKNLSHPVMFYLEINPARDVPKPQKREAPGERDLSWEEIKLFWHSISDSKNMSPDINEVTKYKGRLPEDIKNLILKIRKDNHTFGKSKIIEILKNEHRLNVSESTVGRIISATLRDKKVMPARELGKAAIALRFILSTGGQRIKEVLSARPQDFYFNSKLWEIPNTKNKKTHVVPLNDLSISIIEGLVKEAIANNSRYLFPLEGSEKDDEEQKPMPITSLSQFVSRFCLKENKKITDKQKEAGEKPKRIEAFEKFTPRDLRRTCKSRMGELGISKEIRDRIQNHALHDVSSKHYDRYDYLPQKREALDKWGEHLQKIIYS